MKLANLKKQPTVAKSGCCGLSHVHQFHIRRCRRCHKKRILVSPPLCGSCWDVVYQMNAGGCTARLYHGPGHQSGSFCSQKRGEKHTKFRGRLLHTVEYSGGYAEWYGQKKFTGYFDDPPKSPRD